MKHINKELGATIHKNVRQTGMFNNKNGFLNADGDSLEKKYGSPTLSDSYYKSYADLYSTNFGQNDVIKNSIISKSKEIANKNSNFQKLDIAGLQKLIEQFAKDRQNSSNLERSATNSLIDKYDDLLTSRRDAQNIAERNIRDSEGGYPNINHKHSNLIKNILDHHIDWVATLSITNYLDYLNDKSKLIEEQIEYAFEKNTYELWKKLDNKGVLNSQKKIIGDKIKELTPKLNTQTGSKVKTNATADELVNGASASLDKKWIFIGVGGLVVLTALYLIFRNKSSN